MPIQALARSFELPLPSPARKRRHLFLEALEHLNYGRLVLGLPDGDSLEFSGMEKGHCGYLKLYDWQVLDDVVARGEMGFADAYINRRWETPDLPALLTLALMNVDALEKFFHGNILQVLLHRLQRLMSGNSLKGSRRNIMAHYDLGNDFYKLWLDDSMTYSCALFEGDETRTLEEAQQAKYQRILKRLSPRPGDHILEIGCGWGGFAEAAARMGVRVTGITLSENQVRYARERLASGKLNHLASFELIDYRKVTGKFDHIVSIGMFEHVGQRYWPTYFETIRKRLKHGGKAMVQSITINDNLFELLHGYSGFIEQVIFPGGMLPSKPHFRSAAAKAGLICHDVYAFGQDYASTTREWLRRFDEKPAEVKALGYDESFVRLWRFYLSSCIAAFTTRRTEVMQVELAHA